MIDIYLDGGNVSLPNKFSWGKAVVFVDNAQRNIKTKFLGLNSSVKIQKKLLNDALNLIKETPDNIWKQRCLNDFDWFKLCAFRYQLLQAIAVARTKDQDDRNIDNLASQIEKLAFNMGIVAVSPQIDQKNLMLDVYKAYLKYKNRED